MVLAAGQFESFGEDEFRRSFLGFDKEALTLSDGGEEDGAGEEKEDGGNNDDNDGDGDGDGEGRRRRFRVLEQEWAEIDWRDPKKNPKGVVAVTSVKHQGGCGSCKRFVATPACNRARARRCSIRENA